MAVSKTLTCRNINNNCTLLSFNPKLNILATASGQRHFRNFDHDSSDSAEDERMEEEAEPWDFSLRLWQIPLTT